MEWPATTTASHPCRSPSDRVASLDRLREGPAQELDPMRNDEILCTVLRQRRVLQPPWWRLLCGLHCQGSCNLCGHAFATCGPPRHSTWGHPEGYDGSMVTWGHPEGYDATINCCVTPRVVLYTPSSPLRTPPSVLLPPCSPEEPDRGQSYCTLTPAFYA